MNSCRCRSMRKPWSRLFVSCWSYQTKSLGTSSGSTNTRLVSGPVPAVPAKTPPVFAGGACHSLG